MPGVVGQICNDRGQDYIIKQLIRKKRPQSLCGGFRQFRAPAFGVRILRVVCGPLFNLRKLPRHSLRYLIQKGGPEALILGQMGRPQCLKGLEFRGPQTRDVTPRV